MTPSQQTPSGTSRPLLETLREIRRGDLLDEAADALQQLVAAVSDTGKVGKMTIEISIAPASKGQGAVKVADKITLKIPTWPAGETILFVTPDNNLVPNNPRQESLDLRSVAPASTATLKTA